MYPFDLVKTTTKKSRGTNKIKYLIIHHTAGGSFTSNVNILSGVPVNNNPVSVHFVIGKGEEVAKIGDPNDILRHCGVSGRGGESIGNSLNAYAIGIEVVGFGENNRKQFIRLTDLVEYLMHHFKIPTENVLRHKDITQLDANRLKNKQLRYQGIPSRKSDIADSFFPWGFENWRKQLTPREVSRYGSN